MLAMTVLSVFRPLACSLELLGPPVTVTVLVPPALPLIVTPAPLKPLTGSLNTAVKLIGDLLVGSAWPAAWLIVTEGRGVSGGAGGVRRAGRAVAEVWPLARGPGRGMGD